METIAPIIQEFLKNHPIISLIVIILVGIFFSITFIKTFIYFLNEIKFIKLENLKRIKEDYLKSISNNFNETINEKNNSSQNQLIKRLHKLIDSLMINEAFQKITGIHIFDDNKKKFFLDLIETTSYGPQYIKAIFPYVKKNNEKSNDLKKENIEIYIKKKDIFFYFFVSLPLIFFFALIIISFILFFLTIKLEFLLLLFVSLLIVIIIASLINDLYLALKFQKEFLNKKTKLLYVPNIMIIIGVILGIWFLISNNSLIIKNILNKTETIKQEKNIKH